MFSTPRRYTLFLGASKDTLGWKHKLLFEIGMLDGAEEKSLNIVAKLFVGVFRGIFGILDVFFLLFQYD